MIKHFPEGFVSFEDSRCQRKPYLPKLNERIIVECIISDNPSVPVLELTANNVITAVSPKSIGNGCFAFDLGSFGEKANLTYKIKCGDEITKAYDLPICEEVTYTSFSHVSKTASGIIGILGNGIGVSFDLSNGCIHAFCSELSSKGTSVSRAFLGDLTVSANELWTIGDKASVKYIKVLFDGNNRAVSSVIGMNVPCNNVFGTGERFDSINQKGKGSSGLVEERCFYQEEVTYMPIPFFFTETGFGFFSDSTVPAGLAFGETFEITRETENGILFNDCFFTGNPSEILKKYYAVSGQPILPPDWVYGVWISANGWNRTEEIYEAMEEMKALDYPASVLVLEPWSDEKTYRVWDETRFHDHEKLVRDAKEMGLHVVLWQISTIHKTYPWRFCADYEEALEHGYSIKNNDGTPYHIPDGWCKGDMVMDFSNPEACDWWFGARKHLLDEGIEGFKTDGGEYLFDKTLKNHAGTSGLTLRNAHPIEYQRAYNAFMKNNGVNGITFSRSGYSGAQTCALHWAGDQSSEWRELRGQFTAGITAGLSGVIFWGFDIGSLAGELPNKELYLRSTALACFCPVMQWHSTVMPDQLAPRQNKEEYNDRSPWNLARQFKDSEIATVSTYFAKLRHSLIPYISSEAKFCTENARPLMAHLCFDYYDDANVWAVNDEYMFGREFLVAPILEEGITGRNVYLPKGKWQDFFTHETYEGGKTVYIECALDSIPVFRKV